MFTVLLIKLHTVCPAKNHCGPRHPILPCFRVKSASVGREAAEVGAGLNVQVNPLIDLMDFGFCYTIFQDDKGSFYLFFPNQQQRMLKQFFQ